MVEQRVEGQPPVELRAVALSKRFGRRMLFRGLSFTLRSGESLAVTGPNGSGKSTLLRILAGVMSPTIGRVELLVGGRTLARDVHPLHAGLVAPYLNVYDGFTPRENLRFIAKARSLGNAGIRIDRVLELVSLDDRADDPVGTFSSGMKQRVKFAAAVLAGPPLLLLDEPRVSLDAAGLAMVDQLATYHRERDGLLIVATNDPQEAARYEEVVRVDDLR